MSFIAGNLAASGWTSAYHTYWIAVPVLIMVALFIPRMAADKQVEHATDGISEQRPASVRLGASFWVMAACFTVYTMCHMIAITSFISVYAAENELGGPEFAGLFTSFVVHSVSWKPESASDLKPNYWVRIRRESYRFGLEL